MLYILNKSYILAFALFLLFLSTTAVSDPITMKFEKTCGFDTRYLQVEIDNPPGGYEENVSSDASFTVNVPVGTLLMASIKSSYCTDKCTAGNSDCRFSCILEVTQKLRGQWTPAVNGEVLDVMCI